MPLTDTTVRVALADDSGLLRQGLTHLLESAGVQVRYAAHDGDDLMRYLAREQPDVVLLDIRMPPTFTEEGLDAAEKIKERYPSVGVMVLSTYGETAYAVRLMRIPGSGVGFMLKDRVDEVDTLVDGIRRVAAGRAAVDPEIVGSLFQKQAAQQALRVLTEQELNVLRLMAEGLSNAGIASELSISHRTVETYAARVFTKLDIPDGSDGNRRVLAVLAWLRNGVEI